MSDIETRNAIITGARLTTEDHNLLSAWLDLDYGGSGQGFGGYALYLPKCFSHHTLTGSNYAGHFIWRVMEVAGVASWDRLLGKAVRVRCEHSKVHAIGNIVRDDWFSPADDFKKMEAAKP